MKARAVFMTWGLAVGACSTTSAPVDVPMDIVGIVSKPRSTGWYLDHCDGGSAIASTPDCVQIGGEIYKVALLDARTAAGERISSRLIMGITAHGLRWDYRTRARVHLEMAPEGFRDSTGIKYLVREWERLSGSRELVQKEAGQ